jgi:tRNA (guanine37-N1)-methyltransferase
MKINILTTLPSFYDVLNTIAVLRRTTEKGIISVNITDINQYGKGGYKRIDDYPAGGGTGMILRADVLQSCIEDNLILHNIHYGDDVDSATSLENIKNADTLNDTQCTTGKSDKGNFFTQHTESYNLRNAMFICTSPRGIVFNQQMAENIATNVENLWILSNRFEGIDQRVIDYYNIQEVSIGDYILTGGDSAVLVMLESIVRLMDGAVGNNESIEEESFSKALDSMLEYDQFTTPATWNGMKIPEVLLSGNHAKIKEWRMQSSRKRTRERK